MKLNLGCGDDIRVGYVNVDLNNKDNKDVVAHDIISLDNMVPNGTADEILSINSIQYISNQNLPSTIENWISKMKSGAILYIESIDYNLLGNMMAYENISSAQISSILYDFTGTNPPRGIYNLVGIEGFLKSRGMETVSKGYKSPYFWIQVKKI